MTSPAVPASRRLVVGMLVGLGALWLLLAALWVPWHPVPGGVPEPVGASELFSPAEIARAEDAARWSRAWSWSSLVLGLVVTGVLGFTRIGHRLVGRLPGPWWIVVPQAVALVLVTVRVVTLPLGAALHAHLVRIGLSTTTWGGWLADVARSQAVEIVGWTLVAWMVVGAARRWPRTWPAVAGVLAGVGVIAASFAWPLVVEPVFNDFASLDDGPLREQVLSVADREGVEVDDVLVADASRRTTTLNAYVSGLWGSRRVVLYDTLVDDAPQDEVVAVVAHELSHARHDDVLTGSLLGAVGAAWAMGGLALLSGRRRLGDARTVPWLVAVAAVATLAASPVQSGISRQIETRSDVDAVRSTGDGAAVERLQVRLARRSLADPTPPAWAHWWWGSHPTVVERVAIARKVGWR